MQAKVLLVEDDKFISRAYKDGLERAGFLVEVSGNGQEALAAIEKGMPEIILLDLIMPEMDGFEFLEELNSKSLIDMTKIVAMSNLGQDADIEKAKELGVVDYLVKSNVSMKDVIEKLKFYLTVNK